MPSYISDEGIKGSRLPFPRIHLHLYPGNRASIKNIKIRILSIHLSFSLSSYRLYFLKIVKVVGSYSINHHLQVRHNHRHCFKCKTNLSEAAIWMLRQCEHYLRCLSEYYLRRNQRRFHPLCAFQRFSETQSINRRANRPGSFIYLITRLYNFMY